MLNSNDSAEVAQLVEQPIRNRQVDGSNPPLGSNFFPIPNARRGICLDTLPMPRVPSGAVWRWRGIDARTGG